TGKFSHLPVEARAARRRARERSRRLPYSPPRDELPRHDRERNGGAREPRAAPGRARRTAHVGAPFPEVRERGGERGGGGIGRGEGSRARGAPEAEALRIQGGPRRGPPRLYEG